MMGYIELFYSLYVAVRKVKHKRKRVRLRNPFPLLVFMCNLRVLRVIRVR